MAVFVDYSLQADARTGNRTTRSAPPPNIPKERPSTITLPELTRLVLQMQDVVHELLRSALDLPFGGPVTYLKGVTFASGVNLTLPHRIAVAPSIGAPGIGIARAESATQIRAMAFHKTAFGDVKVIGADARTITLASNANLTADVLLWVVP